MWIVVAAAWFLTAAKAHGRQLRVERELAGHSVAWWAATFALPVVVIALV